MMNDKPKTSQLKNKISSQISNTVYEAQTTGQMSVDWYHHYPFCMSFLDSVTFSKMFALGVQFCQCSCVNSTGIIDARNKNINLSAEALLLHSYTKVLAQ